MTNHVHLIAIPQRGQAMELALKQTHGRYATYFNARYESSGHVWQSRYYSCPLDLAHLWTALRYTELNPVRAGLVADPMAYRWSSAAAHCGTANPAPWFKLAPWPEPWSVSDWRDYLSAAVDEDETDAIRQGTHTGRPLGGESFVQDLERALTRRLVAAVGGRPKKRQVAAEQAGLPLE